MLLESTIPDGRRPVVGRSAGRRPGLSGTKTISAQAGAGTGLSLAIFRTAQKHHGSVNSFDNENIEQSLPYLTFWGFKGFSRLKSEY